MLFFASESSSTRTRHSTSYLRSFHMPRKCSLQIALCIACLLLLSGCALPWKQHSVRTSSPRPTAQQFLGSVQKNFAAVNAFHVVMQVQNAGPVVPGHVEIRTAKGDIAMPDKIKAQATVIFSGQPVTVNRIIVADQQVIT